MTGPSLPMPGDDVTAEALARPPTRRLAAVTAPPDLEVPLETPVSLVLGEACAVDADNQLAEPRLRQRNRCTPFVTTVHRMPATRVSATRRTMSGCTRGSPPGRSRRNRRRHCRRRHRNVADCSPLPVQCLEHFVALSTTTLLDYVLIRPLLPAGGRLYPAPTGLPAWRSRLESAPRQAPDILAETSPMDIPSCRDCSPG